MQALFTAANTRYLHGLQWQPHMVHTVLCGSYTVKHDCSTVATWFREPRSFALEFLNILKLLRINTVERSGSTVEHGCNTVEHGGDTVERGLENRALV